MIKITFTAEQVATPAKHFTWNLETEPSKGGGSTMPETIFTVEEAIARLLDQDNWPESMNWSLAALREIATDTFADLEMYLSYDDGFVSDLVQSFQWWILTAENLLVLNREKGAPEAFLAFRDRLIAMESGFWVNVVPARRQSTRYLSSAEKPDSEPVRELVGRFFSYRDAVCAHAREVLPADLCEQLGLRI